MILYEYEGKELLKKAGIAVPKAELLDQQAIVGRQVWDNKRVVLKAQVLSGKRADVGGILMVNDVTAVSSQLHDLFQKTIKGERIEKVLVEEQIDISKEFYVSLSYDTDYRSPILSISESGGTGIEEKAAAKIGESWGVISAAPIDILNQTTEVAVQYSRIKGLKEVLDKLIHLFFEQDCLLLEVNPLVLTKSGEWMALDAKVKLDDDARSRHTDWNYSPRMPSGRVPTENEINAKKIDEGDYRGTAGSAYFDLNGDIAILSSGGGVSLTAMDALITAGGKPANFTEYSGNPPKEKVVKLTKIVLNKPNIHGIWVVGTVAANFTDIYETLSGLIEGLREAQNELRTEFKMPIVIRRGGPRDKEAFEMLREVKDFDLILQGEETSISESAKIIAEKAKEYSMSS
jgi:citryl-CoA synthetase large subunit